MRMKMTKIAIVICVIVITIVMAISAARIVIAATQKVREPDHNSAETPFELHKSTLILRTPPAKPSPAKCWAPNARPRRSRACRNHCRA